MKLEANKAIVRKSNEELWAKAKTSLINELYAPSGVPLGFTAEQLKIYIEEFHKAVPDLKLTIKDILAEGDQVVLHFQYSGTNVGPSPHPKLGPMPPTGRSFAYTGISIYRIANGKIVSDEFQSNWTDMLIKMGINLVPGEPT